MSTLKKYRNLLTCGSGTWLFHFLWFGNNNLLSNRAVQNHLYKESYEKWKSQNVVILWIYGWVWIKLSPGRKALLCRVKKRISSEFFFWLFLCGLFNFIYFDPTFVPLLEQVLRALPGHISLLPWLPEIFNKILRSFELPVGEAWKKWGPAAAPMTTGSIPGIIIK